MTDYSSWLRAAKDMSDLELELDRAMENCAGGTAEKRAAARVEIAKRERAAATALAEKQLLIADRQSVTAEASVRAATLSARATVAAAVVAAIGVVPTLVQAIKWVSQK
jgi:hypothetical protein